MKQLIIYLSFLFMLFNVSAQKLMPFINVGHIQEKGSGLFKTKDLPSEHPTTPEDVSSKNSLISLLKLTEKVKKHDLSNRSGKITGDTLVIGATPGDSVYISGIYSYDGTILVYGDGILVLDNAQALIRGDLIVWGEEARVEIINSSVIFPQSYIYERSMIAAGGAKVNISNSLLDYSGLSHNLVIIDSANVKWNNVNKSGFTTCGLNDKGSIIINGTNQAGEFIMTGDAAASFRNASTVLIWHHIPDGAALNASFPAGQNLDTWQFDNTNPGVSDINYSYSIDTCTNVMWGLMPEPGSSCNINNSVIRAIGVWFKNQNNFTVSGLVNNSFYANYTAALSNHNIVLQNTDVETWSLYMFGNASGEVKNCILGEAACFADSEVEMDNCIIDGSGGYLFSEDISLIVSAFTNLNCDLQSKGNSFSYLIYGGVNWGRAIAMDKSLMFIIQSNLISAPEIYNDAMVWYLKMEGQAVLITDSNNPVYGSAWIKKASPFYPHEFSHYTIEYRHPDSSNWLPLCGPEYNEVDAGVLCNWNTTGITAGSYLLKLSMYDNTPECNKIEALRLYHLSLPYSVGSIDEDKFSCSVFPNPAKENVWIKIPGNTSATCFIYNLQGKEMINEDINGEVIISVGHLSSGMYFYLITDGIYNVTGKLLIK